MAVLYTRPFGGYLYHAREMGTDEALALSAVCGFRPSGRWAVVSVIRAPSACYCLICKAKMERVL